MPGAETLPGAIDRAEQLLREHGRIDLRGGLEAIVAIAAAFERILAKVPQQQRAATLDRFDQPPQRVQSRPFARDARPGKFAQPHPRARELDGAHSPPPFRGIDPTPRPPRSPPPE